MRTGGPGLGARRSGAQGRRVRGRALGAEAELVEHPVVEAPDVPLDPDVDAARGERARAHARLDPLADLPILAVDAVEEPDRVLGVEARAGDDLRREEPVA